MIDFKIFISTYYYQITIVGSLLILLMLSSFLFYKNKDLNLIRFFSVIVLSLILFIVYPLILSTYPIYSKGQCFTYDKVINEEPKEEWHRPYEKKKLEFLVLKVGKENYYVSSSEPKLEDFPFKKDGKTKKSDCSTIFRRK